MKLNKRCTLFISDCCKNFVISHKTAKFNTVKDIWEKSSDKIAEIVIMNSLEK